MLEAIKNAIYNTIIEIIVLLINSLKFIIDLLPVPSFLDSVSNLYSSIPPETLFFLAAFKIPQGMAMLGTALTARLIIRAIPYFGSILK